MDPATVGRAHDEKRDGRHAGQPGRAPRRSMPDLSQADCGRAAAVLLCALPRCRSFALAGRCLSNPRRCSRRGGQRRFGGLGRARGRWRPIGRRWCLDRPPAFAYKLPLRGRGRPSSPARHPGAQVAQSVEQGIENPRVGSSILSLGTTALAVPPISPIPRLRSSGAGRWSPSGCVDTPPHSAWHSR